MIESRIIDLSEIRAMRSARLVSDALIAVGPTSIGKGDKITLTESGRHCVVLGLTEDGRPVCCVDGIRTVLARSAWEAVS